MDNLTANLIASATCFVALLAYHYYKNVYSYWSKRNVSGPKPLPFVGNLPKIIFSDRFILDTEWRNKYGKVYGVFQGQTPGLFIADPELMVQICVKDFDAFPNHNRSEFANKIQKNFLVFMQDETWKHARSLMSPTFTSGKIKRMFKFLGVCADDIVDCFGEQLKGDSKSSRSAIVDVKETYSFFTMDAITTCCYGIKLQREGSNSLKSAASRNNFIRDAMQIFEFRMLRLLVLLCIPKPILRFFKIEQAPMKNFQPLVNKVKQLIDSRRKSSKKFDDYLQLLIDAKLDDKMELNEMDLEENHHAGLTKESLLADQDKMVGEVKAADNTKVALSELETLSGAVFLLPVGLETTATLLCNVSYALAFHQEIQQKLYEELLKIVEYSEDKSKCSFSYEALTSCRYLDAVISESLRRLSPVVHTDRIAARDYYFEKYDISIQKGTRLFLALYSVMNDPDSWENPEVFNPERFMPGNKEKIVPGSYCPFGIGPRHCLGMRFSLTEGKLALAKTMMNYKFLPAPDTRFPPPLTRSSGITKLATPHVKIVPRN